MKKIDHNEFEEGDIFITELERNLFGALKIVKIGKMLIDEEVFSSDGDDKFLIAVLDVIDFEKPRLSDSRLNYILFANRFFCENEPIIGIFVADPKYNKINNYEFLGNIPLTDFEKKLKLKIGSGRDGINGGFPLLGVIEHNFGNNAFLEWRWKNEREEFEREVKDKNQTVKEKRKNKILEPKKMMPDNLFWEIISLLNWKESDDDHIIEPAINYLSKLKVSEIKQFEENLTYKLYCIDTKEHAKNAGDIYNEEDEFVSVDLFLYARCAVVANGRDFYELVLKEPTQMPMCIEFEALLTLSSAAYELKMNKEFDYSTGCDYETYSNKAGWM